MEQRVRRVLLLLMAIAFWLLALPVAAQGRGVRIDDPGNRLGGQAGAVRDAAQRLADAGADVVVVVSDAANRAESDQAVQQLVGSITPTRIIFFVAPQAEQTSLRYGSRWIETLDPVQRQVQAEQMNPRFAAGDLAGGLIAGIDAVQTAINPPPPPPPNYTWLWIIGGVLALTAAGLVLAPVLRRRRDAATAVQTARERTEAARRTAGAAIADLAALVDRAQEKAQYDRLSYSEDNTARLAEMQGSGIQLFQQAQAAFDAAEERRTQPTQRVEDLDAIAGQYAEAQRLAAQAQERVAEAEAFRAQLDAQGAPSTGPTQRL
jgi:hypothetical protein